MSEFDKNRLCIGIDLGTTNTTVAVSRITVNDIIVVTDEEIYQVGATRTSETLPSILYVKDGKEYIGNKAMDLKKNYILSSTAKPTFLENTKLYIGTQHKWEIEGKVYTAIDVATKILSTVRKSPKISKIAETAYVCITVPANFNTDDRNNTVEAARRAGFPNAELREEPKAAILSFLNDEREKREFKQLDVSTKKNILVIDIGGGTCDICVEGVVENNKGGYKFDPIAKNRDNLGGADFDTRIAIFLAKKYGITDPDDVAFAQLRDIGQTFKEGFSGHLADYIYEEYDANENKFIESPTWKQELAEVEPVSLSLEVSKRMIDFTLTGPEFYEAISPLIYNDENSVITNKDDKELYKNMEELICNTLTERSVDLSDIDVIFLTGGMAYCVVMKAALMDIFKKKIICPDKPLLAVSRGASLMNKYENDDVGLTDKMSRSIMIETNSGYFKKLVSAGECVPITKKVDEIFRTTSRNGVVIRLFEGKDEFDNQLRKLNNVYTIKFDHVCDINREFEIEYSIDRTKQLKFKIRFLDDNSTYNIEAQIQSEKEDL